MSEKGKRLSGLDIFRVMAALVIFLFHSVIHLGCHYGVFSAFINMGAIFMTGFFMLSGFVLFVTWKQKNLSNLPMIKLFYHKRFISIYPLYWLILFLWVLSFGTMREALLLAPVEILGLQSTFSSLFYNLNNDGTWFISCMAICYLVYPFGQECLKQMTIKKKVILMMAGGGILLYAPLVVILFETGNIYSNPFYRCLEFLIGIILASVYEVIDRNKFPFLFTWKCFWGELAVLIIAVSFFFKRNFGVYDYMLYNWIALPVFICMIVTLSGITWENSVIFYLSSISYCFFLVQFWVWPITEIFLSYLHIQSNAMRICLSLMLCILLSVMLHELFEKPVTKFLQKHTNAISV